MDGHRGSGGFAMEARAIDTPILAEAFTRGAAMKRGMLHLEGEVLSPDKFASSIGHPDHGTRSAAAAVARYRWGVRLSGLPGRQSWTAFRHERRGPSVHDRRALDAGQLHADRRCSPQRPTSDRCPAPAGSARSSKRPRPMASMARLRIRPLSAARRDTVRSRFSPAAPPRTSSRDSIADCRCP